MKDAFWIIAAVLALGLGAIAGHKPEAAAETSERQQPQHSRDVSARDVCNGQPFEWEGGVLICHRERQ